MPIVFVHGVNVRQDETYKKELLQRDNLFLNVFYPLSGLSCPENAVINAYWGDLAPVHTPGNPFLPGSHGARRQRKQPESDDLLNGQIEDKPQSALEMARSGPIIDVLDLLLSFAADEKSGELSDEEQAQLVSRLAYKAVRLAQRFKSLDEQRHWLKGMDSDEELLFRLADELAEDSSSGKGPDLLLSHSRERLHHVGDWLKDKLHSANKRLLKPHTVAANAAAAGLARVRARARQARTHLAANALVLPARRLFHSRLSNFVGDSFYYFGKRGTRQEPGPVPERVMSVLRQAAALVDKARDPFLIVVAHSMGGIILFDLVTYFDTGVNIDFLVTVGSQFPLFADLNMFHGLNTQHLPHPKPACVKHWINILDPNDFLGFAAGELFDDIEDVEYASGRLGAATHADYFKFASFYECLANALKKRIAAPV